jgi:hypothetical protein
MAPLLVPLFALPELPLADFPELPLSVALPEVPV